MKRTATSILTAISVLSVWSTTATTNAATSELATKKPSYLYGPDHMKVRNKEYGVLPGSYIAHYTSDQLSSLYDAQRKKWHSLPTDGGYLVKKKKSLYLFGMLNTNAYQFNVQQQKATPLKGKWSPYFVTNLSQNDLMLSNREPDIRQSRIYYGTPTTLAKGPLLTGIFGVGWRDAASKELWVATNSLDMKDEQHVKKGYVYRISKDGKHIRTSFTLPHGDFTSVVPIKTPNFLLTGKKVWYRVNTKKHTVQSMKNPLQDERLEVIQTFPYEKGSVVIVMNRDQVADHFQLVYLSSKGTIEKKRTIHYPASLYEFQRKGHYLYVGSQIVSSSNIGGHIGIIDLRSGKVVAQRLLPTPRQKEEQSFIHFQVND
ncbi:hypothetical protein A374_03899 [Fictibacillus macauensis ZFHKF-1]|uniref:Lipoprotein n=1 Tax=Fictibacillus macauensis ZFHKF-1 TaxID=1196324 RepID=I8ALZ8_9BACL|nr:hypothetical protein [Fictibacillus macauensis]EIT86684.1 hypothetical protein A374_03899 [Fictibacillus macauensis ZFHKF-1]